MQAARFDEISMVAASVSRRAAFRTIAGLTLGGTLGVLGREHPASARCREKWSQKRLRIFIRQAARRYDQSYKKMLCVARCESTGSRSLEACAYNPTGPWHGMFQYLRSTWRTTPYHKKSMYHPKFAALATGWMWKERRQNEWSCYPQCRNK
ncbi:MAG: hypothetical protein M3464_14265 [Chloroflexota bacterium]|nr:hypothetical protein [Chloroflexota bacterium]